jgi:hypothetical protein
MRTPLTGTRQACEPQAKRVLHTKKKRRMIVHALRYPSLRTQRAGFVPSWCSVTKTEAKQPDNACEAYEPQAERTPERSLPPLRKPTTMTRGGSTGSVGDAYHKKKEKRNLLVDRQYQKAVYNDF